MEKIRRTSLLYKTGVEYGDYTINHVLGCSHGCLYPCYAFMMARRFGRVKDYGDWLKPRLVENAIELLVSELPRLRSKIKSVHLCFTTDPFMVGYPKITDMSLKIIRILNEEGIKCTVLTKGVLPSELTSFGLNNEWGISLVALDEAFRIKTEPYTANYKDRIQSLKYLHDKGCKTWVSIEPYPTPNIIEQNIGALLDQVGFVDRIIFGRLHYNSLVAKYKDYQVFYNQSARKVIDFCLSHGIEYHIKAKTMM